MVHTLEAFHAPSAAVALPDNRTILVANTARGEYGLIMGRGSVSRVNLGEDGRLKVDQLRFIKDLNGPVGMELLRSKAGPLPAGTLVVTVGGSWVVTADGERIEDDAVRGTGLAFFDAATGEPRGRVLLGEGSAAATALGHPVSDPSIITADPDGNLYLIDVDAATTRSSRRAESNAGVVKISVDALAPLLRDEAPPPGTLFHAPEHALPTVLLYSPYDDALYWGTFAGELRRLPGGDMTGRTAVITVSKRVGTMACLGVTPSGTLFGSTADGMLVSIHGKRSKEIRFRPETRFLSPGSPAVVPAPDGNLWVVLPEQGGGGVGPWRQRTNVLELSADL
jgi:hypothetical protein